MNNHVVVVIMRLDHKPDHSTLPKLAV